MHAPKKWWYLCIYLIMKHKYHFGQVSSGVKQELLQLVSRTIRQVSLRKIGIAVNEEKRTVQMRIIPPVSNQNRLIKLSWLVQAFIIREPLNLHLTLECVVQEVIQYLIRRRIINWVAIVLFGGPNDNPPTDFFKLIPFGDNLCDWSSPLAVIQLTRLINMAGQGQLRPGTIRFHGH